MSDQRNPGPPLLPEDEFCACQAPSTREYVRAAATGLGSLLAGAGAWLLVTLLMQRVSGAAFVLIGWGIGWAVHRAAGRHRSPALGFVAAGSSLFASLLGFALLWLPAMGRVPLSRRLTWYELVMIALGALVAYGQAAPRKRSGGLQ